MPLESLKRLVWPPTTQDPSIPLHSSNSSAAAGLTIQRSQRTYGATSTLLPGTPGAEKSVVGIGLGISSVSIAKNSRGHSVARTPVERSVSQSAWPNPYPNTSACLTFGTATGASRGLEWSTTPYPQTY